MSAYYEVDIEVTNFKKGNQKKIVKAINEGADWDKNHQYVADEGINIVRTLTLYGGTGEEEFAEEIRDKVFTANGESCDIEVKMTCLEDLPYNTYSFSKEEKNYEN